MALDRSITVRFDPDDWEVVREAAERGESPVWGFALHDPDVSLPSGRIVALEGQRRPDYRCVALDPRLGPAEARWNDQVFASGPVWGLEVTVPALAERCAVNIDPQHTGGYANRTAIEDATTRMDLPPDGAVLATVRPDADSVGAMAALWIRRAHALGDRPIPSGFGERIAIIADADREASGPWPGPRPIPPIEDADLLLGPAAVVNALAQGVRRLDDQVRHVREWLEGRLPPQLWVRKRDALIAEATDALRDLNVVERDGIAVVTGTHRYAMSLGYRLAPVVVATNPEFRFQSGPAHRKHTVARWNTDILMDWDGMLAELRDREPGWGGSTSICGSPQGQHSTLTTEEVVEIVRSHRRPRGPLAP